jgi:hypothetical protein
MIWLSWRQFRTQAIVAGSVLAGFAIVLLATGFSLVNLYNASGLPGCQAKHDCSNAVKLFQNNLHNSVYEFIYYLALALIYLTPALIGAFWGAPLVAREVETGTLRLAWSQSVGRSRWLLIKVAMLGLAAMTMAGLLTLMFYWWSQPAFEAGKYAPPGSGLSLSRLSPLQFGINGVAPLGYAAFAFAVGLTVGVVIKRTLPAMAITLAMLAVVLIAWPSLVRPHLVPPVQSTTALRSSEIGGLGITSKNVMTVFVTTNKPGAWVLSDQAVDATGQQYAGPPPHACITAAPANCNKAIVALHLKQALSYEPASRFWAIQGFESGAYVLLAVLLAAGCAWWINRRRLA